MPLRFAATPGLINQYDIHSLFAKTIYNGSRIWTIAITLYRPAGLNIYPDPLTPEPLSEGFHASRHFHPPQNRALRVALVANVSQAFPSDIRVGKRFFSGCTAS